MSDKGGGITEDAFETSGTDCPYRIEVFQYNDTEYFKLFTQASLLVFLRD